MNIMNEAGVPDGELGKGNCWEAWNRQSRPELVAQYHDKVAGKIPGFSPGGEKFPAGASGTTLSGFGGGGGASDPASRPLQLAEAPPQPQEPQSKEITPPLLSSSGLSGAGTSEDQLSAVCAKKWWCLSLT